MRRVVWILSAIGLIAGACTPDKKEEPKESAVDAGKIEKKETRNPYQGLTPTEMGSHSKACLHVAFSPDGNQLVSAGKDKLVKLWNVASGTMIREFKGHTEDVMMAEFSPDGKLLVSASKDESARVWDVTSGKSLKTLKIKPPNEKKMSEEELAIYAATPKPQMNWATFSADSKKVITASDDFVLRLWDVATGKLELVFEDMGCRQNRVYRRKDAPGWVSSAGCMDDGVSYLKFWDPRGNLENQQGDENHDAHFLAFDRAGKWLITADGSVSFSVYSAQGSYLKRIMVGAYHFCVEFGLDDNSLLVGSDAGNIFVYEPGSWKRKGKIQIGSPVAVDDMAVSPADGSLAVALRNGKVLHFKDRIK